MLRCVCGHVITGVSSVSTDINVYCPMCERHYRSCKVCGFVVLSSELVDGMCEACREEVVSSNQ